MCDESQIQNIISSGALNGQISSMVKENILHSLRDRCCTYSKEKHDEDFPRKARPFSFSEYMFGWVYLLLSWNLMGRTNNIQDLHVNHITWENDSMVIKFAKTKAGFTLYKILTSVFVWQ